MEKVEKTSDALPQTKKIDKAISDVDKALEHLYSARKYLTSAKKWGVYDIFCGGCIASMVKQSKIQEAERELRFAKRALESLFSEINDFTDIHTRIVGNFLTFADFFFDGFIVDIAVQKKISEAKIQCINTITKVTEIKDQLIAKRDSMN